MELTDLFKMIDADGSGSICGDEFYGMLAADNDETSMPMQANLPLPFLSTPLLFLDLPLPFLDIPLPCP